MLRAMGRRGLAVACVMSLLGVGMSAGPAQAATWVKNSQYYSITQSFPLSTLQRCAVVKQFGNILFEQSADTANGHTTRRIRNPQLLAPKINVTFYDKCGSGRKAKSISGAQVYVTAGWTDGLLRPKISGYSVSVEAPWAVSFSGNVTAGLQWATCKYAPNSPSTRTSVNFGTSGTFAKWRSLNATIEPWTAPPSYPKLKVYAELLRLEVVSSGGSHTVAPSALPRKGITVG